MKRIAFWDEKNTSVPLFGRLTRSGCVVVSQHLECQSNNGFNFVAVPVQDHNAGGLHRGQIIPAKALH